MWPNTFEELCFSEASELCATCHILKDGGEPGRCLLNYSICSRLRQQYVKGAWGDCCRRGQSPLHSLLVRGGGTFPTLNPAPSSLALFYSNPKDMQGTLARAAAGATKSEYGQRLCYVISIRNQLLKIKAADWQVSRVGLEDKR